MDVLKEGWGLRRQLFIAAVVAVGAIIPLLYPNSPPASCGCVVVVMALLWMTESFPLAVTALIPLVAYPLLGVMSAKAVSREYLSDSNFIFVGSMITAAAVEVTHLHERVALRVLLLTGTHPRWLMLGFQLATCFVSMWITNTATTTLMLPILLRIIHQLEKIRNKRPESEDTAERGKEEHGDVHHHHTAPHLLDPASITPPQLRIYKGLLLSVCYSASIGGTGTLIGTAPNLILSEYINAHSSNTLSFYSWLLYAAPGMCLMLAFSWLALQATFIGLPLWGRGGAVAPVGDDSEVIHRVLESRHAKLGALRFDEGTVLVVFLLQIGLWLTRQPGIVPGWGVLFKDDYVTDGTVVMFISLLLFFLPGSNPFASRPPKSPKSSTAILTWHQLERRVSWSTVILLGGSMAMAKGVEASGLSELVGRELDTIQKLPETLFILLAATLATALTEFSSNVATASIFIPVLGSIAKRNGVNPLAYTLPVTISCSFAFMFPAGTPPNAIVFSSGLLRVTDMMRGGWLLNIFALLITVFLTRSYGSLIFDFQPQPQAAGNSSIETPCAMLNLTQ